MKYEMREEGSDWLLLGRVSREEGSDWLLRGRVSRRSAGSLVAESISSPLSCSSAAGHPGRMEVWECGGMGMEVWRYGDGGG